MSPVTIFLPTFERAQYIREAIDSALAQTFTDFVLSIGDNSRDDSHREGRRRVRRSPHPLPSPRRATSASRATGST